MPKVITTHHGKIILREDFHATGNGIILEGVSGKKHYIVGCHFTNHGAGIRKWSKILIHDYTNALYGSVTQGSFTLTGSGGVFALPPSYDHPHFEIGTAINVGLIFKAGVKEASGHLLYYEQ